MAIRDRWVNQYRGPICGHSITYAAMIPSSQDQLALKMCPICKIAMVASRSNNAHRKFDTYTCLDCGSVITSSSTTADSAGKEKP
jgi:transposase-like protein